MDESHKEMQHLLSPPSLDLDLQLSISAKPPSDSLVMRRVRKYNVEAAEQIRLAGMERDYAERVREMTRREMELAEAEFARARAVWERAREDVQRAERMKEMATQKMESAACMVITCQSCRQKFRP